MDKCSYFIFNSVIKYPEFYSKCEVCVQWSFKYKDCKLHGNDRGTAIVHGRVNANAGRMILK